MPRLSELGDIDQLDELTRRLGRMVDGELLFDIDPDNPIEPGDGFTGMRIKGSGGADYGGSMYALACVLNDALGLGLALDGTGVFAGGAATIGALGILVTGLNYIYRHTGVNEGNTRIGKMSMTLEDGGTVPVLAFDLIAEAGAELLLNGDAEHGDLSHWTKTTETGGIWGAATGLPQAGTYSFCWLPQNSTNSGVLTSDRMAATAALDYLVSGYTQAFNNHGLKFTGSYKVEVKWYDHASAGSLLRTDLIGNTNSIAWFKSEKTIEAPATALSAAIILTCTDIRYESAGARWHIYFDTLSFSAASVAQRLWLGDDGVKCSNGLYPKRMVAVWGDESISNATKTTTHDAGMNYGYYEYVTAANANNGDTYTWGFMLAKGTYTLKTLGLSWSVFGKYDITLDGVSIATGQDWYSGASTYNVVKSVANVAVTYDGYHILKYTCNGKTGSDYGSGFVKLWMYQTAD